MDVDSLLRSQVELQGRIARATENLKKLGAAKITTGALESRLQQLDANWRKFETTHDTLVSVYWQKVNTLEYISEDYHGTVEEEYLQQRGAFLDLMQAARVQPTEGNIPAAPAAEGHSRRLLPHIQLPHFSGVYEEWPSFRDLFKSLVQGDTSLSRVERLHYLKTSLRGEAELLVRNMPTTEENYERAWSALVDHYENKRLIVRSCFASFTALPRMKAESAQDLKRVFLGMISTCGTLESIGRPITGCADLFVHLVVEMLDPQTRREWETSISGTVEPPSYDALKTFLEGRLRTLEALSPTKPDTKTANKPASSNRSARSHMAQQSGKRKSDCALCHRGHYILFCDEFKKKDAKARKEFATSNKLCLNCFGKHALAECQSKVNCLACKERHHTSIHDACATSPTSSAVALHVCRRHSRAAVLLATARVHVADRFGTRIPVRALVDPGSEVSLVSEALAQRLRLTRVAATIDVFGVGGQRTGVARGRVSLLIYSRMGDFSIQVPALVLPQITASGPRVERLSNLWPQLQELTLADPEFMATDPVDLLLGADVFATIIEEGLRKGGKGMPIAQRTTLGWILSGVVGNGETSGQASSFQCRVDDELTALVRRFWEQEEPPRTPLPLTSEEQACEDFFTRTVSRTSDGRYTVRLPVAPAMPALIETRKTAIRVLHHMEHRFRGDEDLRIKYRAFMAEYEALGHMAPVQSMPKADRSCYLPHHGVIKRVDDSTKLRVVFNGSSEITSGDSLNRFLLTGPNLLPPLLDVLLRWRTHRFAMLADVEKMYRQVRVHPDDQDLQRIVWRDQEVARLQEYRLTTVTYGLACAPYLAMRTLRQLASDEQLRFPLGAEVLRRDVYVDDILTGADSLEDAVLIQGQLIGLCTAGGFPLRKWSANTPTLLTGIPMEHQQPLAGHAWENDAGHSTLGLRWHPGKDSFSFQVQSVEIGPATKRSVLSHAARLFDPLGWLAPVTISAKVLVQSAWLQGLDWDEPVSAEDERAWRQYLEELPHLDRVRVPRWMWTRPSAECLELHGFADASERAYAAVVYLKTFEGGAVRVSLVAAKSKVAPVRRVSLPRLELCGANLLATLVCHVQAVTGLSGIRKTLWLDSTVALAWIRGHPSRWTTFVANRVAHIQEQLPDAQWRHVPGTSNPADCASRGMLPRDLLHHDLWWHGPPWLTDANVEPPSAEQDLVDLPEQRARAHAAVYEPADSEMLLRFSSLHRLLRVTAWCRRWLGALDNRRLARVSGPLMSCEIDAGRRAWIRVTQATWYAQERRSLDQHRPLPSGSPLAALTPVIDEEQLLRVGGRLKHSLLGHDEKHPVILPAASHLTELVVDACHRQTLHGGVQLTLGYLRMRYWVPGGRRLVKRIIHRCPPCVRWRAASPQPIMGNLPGPRVRPSRAFLHTGVDYAGPVMLRTSKGRGQKAYKAFLSIFVCLSTRAVHLEVVSDYTTEAFLAAFRRFVSRRGLCETLWSDRGTNFVGADAQLRALFREARSGDRSFGGALAGEGVDWRFSPPAAPHFGGLWEAAVKSVKHHLRRVIGDRTLTFEEMATFLSQVEAVLNSRPLQALSDDPEDLEALTPGHFLVGNALTAIPEPSLVGEPANRLSRWRELQQMRDHFWQRWSREYLQAITARNKWRKPAVNPRIGDLCLVRSETSPPSRWPLARIINVHPGDDGQIRVVTVRTATTTLKRPIVKIVIVPGASTEPS